MKHEFPGLGSGLGSLLCLGLVLLDTTWALPTRNSAIRASTLSTNDTTIWASALSANNTAAQTLALLTNDTIRDIDLPRNNTALRGAGKPKVPLSVRSRWIVDADGQRVKLRCINWAGHLETNVPEGLHRQPIEHMADWIVAQDFNCVRLTYATDMTQNPSLSVDESFRRGARAAKVDEAAVMVLYHAAVQKNPFLHNASVIDVFDRVQATLWERGVMTILDNHVSHSSWCCDLLDGNGWWKDAPFPVPWNSRYFDTQQWQRGLGYMAGWSRSRPGIVGLSLRNELRAFITQMISAPVTWLSHMPPAGRIVHDANPDALVIVGGINGGTDLTPLYWRNLNTTGWTHKRVWEAHSYSFTFTTPGVGICPLQRAAYGALYGFVLKQNEEHTGPLFLSEFGVGLSGGSHDGLSGKDRRYLKCLVKYMESNDADWALWAIQGSYYIRAGKIDRNETWGALDYEWKDWRNSKFKNMLGGMFYMTQGP
ncbi:hypothetical protein CDD81_810 [Ophiocordyceps australis]|uniref:Glycoside hydrolase family 5 domain-containing protein n=1 Tax=Ophiocordyceps australis TaxID=1399860 RepID=A0A2C5Y1E8_9HYPO|nr:hypothetical protein CDD81_810 [Ophiocordyceps australis]